MSLTDPQTARGERIEEIKRQLSFFGPVFENNPFADNVQWLLDELDRLTKREAVAVEALNACKEFVPDPDDAGPLMMNAIYKPYRAEDSHQEAIARIERQRRAAQLVREALDPDSLL